MTRPMTLSLIDGTVLDEVVELERYGDSAVYADGNRRTVNDHDIADSTA